MRISTSQSVTILTLGLVLVPSPASVFAANPTEAWRKLVDDHWEFVMTESPLFATRVGDMRFNDQLGKVGVDHEQRRQAARLAFRKRATAVPSSELPKDDRLNYEIWLRLLNDEIAEHEFQSHLIPITNRSGFHIKFAELPKRVPLKTKQDYQNYVKRYPCTKLFPGTTCKSPFNKNSRTCRSFDALPDLRHLSKAGRCTRNDSDWRPVSTKILTPISDA